MKLDAIQSVPLTLEANQRGITEKAMPPFSTWLMDTVSHTNTKLVEADYALQQLATGQTVSLHQTMLTLEEAKLSFQFLEQLRNRFMAAYQDIVKEQI